MEDTTVTTNAAAIILGVKPRTVTRYIEQGWIIATKKGRDYLIENEELQRFQRERRKPGRPGKGQCPPCSL